VEITQQLSVLNGKVLVTGSVDTRFAGLGCHNSANWPGVQFYWGGFYERWIGMDSSGNLNFFQTDDPSNGNNFQISAAGGISSNDWSNGLRVSQVNTGFSRLRTEGQRAVIEAFNWEASAGARCSLDTAGTFRAITVVATPSP